MGALEQLNIFEELSTKGHIHTYRGTWDEENDQDLYQIYALKPQFELLDLDSCHDMLNFYRRVIEIQQQVAAGSEFWRPILISETQALSAHWCCTDTPSLADLIGKEEITSSHLHFVINSVLQGLIDLRNLADCTLTNITPENIFLKSRTGDLKEGVVLSFSFNPHDEIGSENDYYGIGRLIYMLVTGTPYRAHENELDNDELWRELGAGGKQWQKTCKSLLASNFTQEEPAILDAHLFDHLLGEVDAIGRTLKRSKWSRLAAAAAFLCLITFGSYYGWPHASSFVQQMTASTETDPQLLNDWQTLCSSFHNQRWLKGFFSSFPREMSGKWSKTKDEDLVRYFEHIRKNLSITQDSSSETLQPVITYDEFERWRMLGKANSFEDMARRYSKVLNKYVGQRQEETNQTESPESDLRFQAEFHQRIVQTNRFFAELTDFFSVSGSKPSLHWSWYGDYYQRIEQVNVDLRQLGVLMDHTMLKHQYGLTDNQAISSAINQFHDRNICEAQLKELQSAVAKLKIVMQQQQGIQNHPPATMGNKQLITLHNRVVSQLKAVEINGLVYGNSLENCKKTCERLALLFSWLQTSQLAESLAGIDPALLTKADRKIVAAIEEKPAYLLEDYDEWFGLIERNNVPSHEEWAAWVQKQKGVFANQILQNHWTLYYEALLIQHNIHQKDGYKAIREKSKRLIAFLLQLDKPFTVSEKSLSSSSGNAFQAGIIDLLQRHKEKLLSETLQNTTTFSPESDARQVIKFTNEAAWLGTLEGYERSRMESRAVCRFYQELSRKSTAKKQLTALNQVVKESLDERHGLTYCTDQIFELAKPWLARDLERIRQHRYDKVISSAACELFESWQSCPKKLQDEVKLFRSVFSKSSESAASWQKLTRHLVLFEAAAAESEWENFNKLNPISAHAEEARAVVEHLHQCLRSTDYNRQKKMWSTLFSKLEKNRTGSQFPEAFWKRMDVLNTFSGSDFYKMIAAYPPLEQDLDNPSRAIDDYAPVRPYLDAIIAEQLALTEAALASNPNWETWWESCKQLPELPELIKTNPKLSVHLQQMEQLIYANSEKLLKESYRFRTERNAELELFERQLKTRFNGWISARRGADQPYPELEELCKTEQEVMYIGLPWFATGGLPGWKIQLGNEMPQPLQRWIRLADTSSKEAKLKWLQGNNAVFTISIDVVRGGYCTILPPEKERFIAFAWDFAQLGGLDTQKILIKQFIKKDDGWDLQETYDWHADLPLSSYNTYKFEISYPGYQTQVTKEISFLTTKQTTYAFAARALVPKLRRFDFGLAPNSRLKDEEINSVQLRTAAGNGNWELFSTKRNIDLMPNQQYEVRVDFKNPNIPTWHATITPTVAGKKEDEGAETVPYTYMLPRFVSVIWELPNDIANPVITIKSAGDGAEKVILYNPDANCKLAANVSYNVILEADGKQWPQRIKVKDSQTTSVIKLSKFTLGDLKMIASDMKSIINAFLVVFCNDASTFGMPRLNFPYQRLDAGSLHELIEEHEQTIGKEYPALIAFLMDLNDSDIQLLEAMTRAGDSSNLLPSVMNNASFGRPGTVVLLAKELVEWNNDMLWASQAADYKRSLEKRIGNAPNSFLKLLWVCDIVDLCTDYSRSSIQLSQDEKLSYGLQLLEIMKSHDLLYTQEVTDHLEKYLKSCLVKILEDKYITLTSSENYSDAFKVFCEFSKYKSLSVLKDIFPHTVTEIRPGRQQITYKVTTNIQNSWNEVWSSVEGGNAQVFVAKLKSIQKRETQ